MQMMQSRVVACMMHNGSNSGQDVCTMFPEQSVWLHNRKLCVCACVCVAALQVILLLCDYLAGAHGNSSHSCNNSQAG